MKIIIIEDEIKAARSLTAMITAIKPEAVIVAQPDSIESAVAWFSANPQPDLIFMDIQLADGLCFEIFKAVKITSPVVFCTAFDEYSLEAFKANGIDYVLKPFSKEDIAAAFKKVDEFKNFFQKEQPDLNNLLAKLSPASGKKSFLVYTQNKYISVPTDTIAFFYIKNDVVMIRTFDQKEYAISQSLDQVHAMLPEEQFFRLNRQYLINFTAIKEVEHYYARKLFVRLVFPNVDKLLVTKEKAHTFLTWMENR
ncbi:response regulator transcription factor [Chitinophaga agrisoli]|uniref:Response regulator transcription factor n=1 Tax=Chitinophaga agrisoli TaxID=2607653 RepID=A0A5B2VU82_9BACT|nr:LytTR family DNA-binding domain-containing protein [Chitinophaga agrisoli]KAA2242605.1 response regulator transcription factor [Chitinophaga agrisoli]